MADGNQINVTTIHSSASKSGNVQLSGFSKLQNTLKPYTLSQENRFPILDSKKPFINTADKPAKSISTLAGLISNPTVEGVGEVPEIHSISEASI